MWGNPTLFHRVKSVEKIIEKRQILIDPLTTNNAIYHDSLILSI